MTRRFRRMAASVAVVLVTSVTLSACDFEVYDLPLPGGTDTGDDPIRVTVVFEDVLDLVPESSVKVKEVNVGKVTDVRLGEDNLAHVELELQRDTELPANVEAHIRMTSLLGEKFVSLAPPATGASAEPLADDAVIPVERTGRNPEVEEVLGALSLVLNGGGVAQLKTITTELNRALEGREDSARSVLTQLETLMGSLDASKNDIITAIEALDRLAQSARGQEAHIDAALAELPSALTSIDQQRDDLVRMLEALRKLGDVGVRVIRASKEGTIAVLRQLQPVLTEAANSGASLVRAMDTVFTYPFVDEVVGRDPQTARNLHMGDYVNLSAVLEIDLRDVIEEALEVDLLPDNLSTTKVVNQLLNCVLSASPSSAPCTNLVGTLQGIPELPAECRDPDCSDNLLCGVLNLVPGLPGGPPAPGGGGGGGAPAPEIDLGELGDLLGLPRAAPGAALQSADDVRVPRTLAELGDSYDPDLVALLTPGVATTAPDREEAAR